MWLLKIRVDYPVQAWVWIAKTHNTFWLSELVTKLLESDNIIGIELIKEREHEAKEGKTPD